jgi:hypothetical protein
MNTCRANTVSMLFLLGLLACATAIAQQQGGDHSRGHRAPSAEQRLAHMSDALDLSGQQSMDMLIVLQQADDNRQALREKTREMLGPEICAERAQTEEAILEILMPEQELLFYQMIEARKDKAKRKGRGRNDLDELDCSN